MLNLYIDLEKFLYFKYQESILNEYNFKNFNKIIE